MTRICITGGPRTGKTTLASAIQVDLIDWRGAKMGGIVRHTDDLIATHGWSDASAEVCGWLCEPGPWIIEGVAVSRALRKWRDAHPGEPPPVDRVIRLITPHVTLSKGQAAMTKGEQSVWSEIGEWLHRHGIRTEYQPMTAHQLRAPSMGGQT